MTTVSPRSLDDEVAAWFGDPAVRHDAFDFFDRLRAEAPIYYSESMESWIVTGFAEASKVMRASRTVTAPMSGRDTTGLYDADGELRPALRANARSLRNLEGDPHTRLRLLVGRALNSPNVARWQEEMVEEVRRALARLEGATSIDLMRDYAYELPMHQICRIMGVPAVDVADYQQWTDDVLLAQIFNASDEQKAIGDAAAVAFREHLTELIEHRRRKPGGTDLLTALIEAEADEDCLTHEELLATTYGLIAAGHSTTAGLIGNAALALARHPSEQVRLRGSLDELLNEAIEEALRYEGPAQWVPRFALEGFELEGEPVPVGGRVILILLAANRDPAVHEDPHRFWIDRPSKKHLSFAAGQHSCIGPHLARAEARTAIDGLIRTFGTLELESEDYEYGPTSSMRQLASLPIRFG